MMAATTTAAQCVWFVAILVLCGFADIRVSARPSSSVSEGSTSVDSAGGSTETDQLILVQAIFRHGDRTPISLYANDPYKNYSWDEGLGFLTLRGKSRMFHYGQTLQNRYSEYLENILLKNVRSQSSFKRRCLETTLAVLAGLFPPTNTTWSKSQELAKLWQPIGVESTEKSRAWLLNPDTECAAATAIKKALTTEDPEMKKFLEDNKEFVAKVTQYSGQQFDSWISTGWVYDAIITEQFYFGDKFQMPEWLAQVGNDTLMRLKQFNDYQFSIYEKWPKYVKLRAGSLLKQSIDNMKEVAAQKEPITANNKKLFLYGTHDTMVSPILLALGFSNEQPTYGSGIIIELRKKQHSLSPTVNLYYANVTNNAQITDFNVVITPLALNTSKRFSKLCPESHCSLDNFATSLKDFLVEDIEKECAIVSKHGKTTNGAMANSSFSFSWLYSISGFILGFYLCTIK